MTAPSVPADTIFKHFVDEDTKQSIKEAVPCEWGKDGVNSGKPCHKPAKWIFHFKRSCSHGRYIGPPYIVFMCTEHKDRILELMGPGGGYLCGGCGCPMVHPGHVVERVCAL